MRMRILGASLVAAVALIIFIVSQQSRLPSPTVKGAIAINPPKAAANFTLQNVSNQPTQLTDLKGKMVLLAFGYTHCPDICPLTLATFKQVRQKLGDKVAAADFVFISVDGQRDTPQVLAQYLPLYDSAIIGLTGPEETVMQVIQGYGGTFKTKDFGGLVKNYTIDHTASFFLLDAKGQWIRTYTYGTRPVDIAADMQLLLSAQ